VQVESAVAKRPPPDEDTPELVLGPKGVELVFILPGGRERRLKAEQQPLGIGFEEDMPLVARVIRAGSEAERLKIQPDWKLKTVDGTSVFNTSVDFAFDALANAFKGLPEMRCAEA